MRNTVGGGETEEIQRPSASRAAQFARGLRDAFGQDRWFQVASLSREEVEKMVETKPKRADLELVPGKVLFGEQIHKRLGAVKVWAGIRKLAMVKQGPQRITWRLMLFNDGDYSDVKVPPSPFGDIKLNPMFSLLWTEDLSEKKPDFWTGKKFHVRITREKNTDIVTTPL